MDVLKLERAANLAKPAMIIDHINTPSIPPHSGKRRGRATILTLVLGNILREITIETIDNLRVWWAG